MKNWNGRTIIKKKMWMSFDKLVYFYGARNRDVCYPLRKPQQPLFFSANCHSKNQMSLTMSLKQNRRGKFVAAEW